MFKEINNESKVVGLKRDLERKKKKVDFIYCITKSKIIINSNKEPEIKRNISFTCHALGESSLVFKSKMPMLLKKNRIQPIT